MKAKRIILLFIIGLLWVLNACRENVPIKPINKEPEIDTATRDTSSWVSPKDSVIDPEIYPQKDDAKDLPENPNEALSMLLQKIDSKKALSHGGTTITDKEYDEIKLFVEKEIFQGKHFTQSEKLEVIFRWITSKISYYNPNKHKEIDNSAYSVFKSRVAICFGYSNLFRIMCQSQDIPTFNALGWLVKVGGHAWNYAYVDGKWKVVDTTNGRMFDAENTDSYKHLLPEYIDISLYEDEHFSYTYEYGWSITEIKSQQDKVILPYSKLGFIIRSFVPEKPLPKQINKLVVGENITCLGGVETRFPLKQHGSELKEIVVSPLNPRYESHFSIVYTKETKELFYIPPKIEKITFFSMPIAKKNTLLNHTSVKLLVFPENTKQIDSYAIENCPKLSKAIVPKDCKVAKDAFMGVAKDFLIERK